MLSQMGVFNKQWKAFIDGFDRLGKRIRSVQDEYDALLTTRRRQLERPLQRIEELRVHRGVEASLEDPAEEADAEPPLETEQAQPLAEEEPEENETENP